MNEFVSKKIGEVSAFSNVGVETFNQGKEALLSVMSEAEFTEAITTQADFAKQLENIASGNEVTTAKAQATGNKLKGMRDTYIGDEWDNPVEIMEWFGFFEGAAIVHWALVKGAATSLGNSELEQLSAKAIDFHQNLLEISKSKLCETGQSRAK